MSSKLLPTELSIKREAIKEIVMNLGFKFDEEMTRTVFFTDINDLIYGVSFGVDGDNYIGVNFAMAVDWPVDNTKRIAALSAINMNYKILKCYYEGNSIVFSCEAFIDSEKQFIEFFKYSISAIQGAYSELEEQHPEAL